MPKLRKNRFIPDAPLVSQETFEKSNYLKWYNRTERHPDRGTVLESLRSLQQSTRTPLANVIETIKMAKNDHDVIQTYTAEVPLDLRTFYSYINEQLHRDDENTIQHLMPFIRRATFQINYNPPSEAHIVYRGIDLNPTQRSNFKVGIMFRFPGFTSTSKSQAKASEFGNTLLVIHIYAGCLQVKDVSEISNYPEEEEFLFSPYSLFEVTAVSRSVITLKAQDNQTPVPKSASPKIITTSDTTDHASASESDDETSWRCCNFFKTLF